MRFDELTPRQRKQLLATAVRNHMAGTGAIFSPWYDFDLCYHEGQLCHVSGGGQRTPIIAQQDLMGLSDDKIWKVVMK